MPSFDVVSRTELPEVDNALQGAMREISTRFDFKGSQCSIERADEVIKVKAAGSTDGDVERRLNNVDTARELRSGEKKG